MKYVLLIYVNPAIWEALSEAERNEVFGGHNDFQKAIIESGEMISSHALAAPSHGTIVRVRDGVTATAAGPYLDTAEFLAGYYLIDCESEERAIQLAALLPDARLNATEVRPVLFSSGLDL